MRQKLNGCALPASPVSKFSCLAIQMDFDKKSQAKQFDLMSSEMAQEKGGGH
jgi:hypothetical protein